ncbi:hypothetical protein AXF42_Ash016770 [Apostasia shenzhenica]|uniref:Uncharacterized protein n=1 Tax=Apostasia shenzhenica TaxID=1088818 RepID=A0A2I0AQB0_9ASPA|nr:hypothetical protein AXF42_Ash016770 [Apostasia shenzhenica]
MNSLADELAKEEKRDAQDILAPAYNEPEVFDVSSNPGSWMDGIQHYLQTGELLSDRHQARKLRMKAARNVLSLGKLFRRCYSLSLAKCVREADSKTILE